MELAHQARLEAVRAECERRVLEAADAKSLLEEQVVSAFACACVCVRACVYCQCMPLSTCVPSTCYKRSPLLPSPLLPFSLPDHPPLEMPLGHSEGGSMPLGEQCPVDLSLNPRTSASDPGMLRL